MVKFANNTHFFKEIGPTIRYLRNRREITMRALAEKVGCSYSYFSRIENNKATPSIEFLDKILEALGYEVILKEREE
jgi:transcriptional regulator with XRE-family HTH domain